MTRIPINYEGEMPPVTGPFSPERMGRVRVIGHPAEYGTHRFHQNSGAKWAHTHAIPEDAPLDDKNALGRHIDKWHMPPYGEDKEDAPLG